MHLCHQKFWLSIVFFLSLLELTVNVMRRLWLHLEKMSSPGFGHNNLLLVFMILISLLYFCQSFHLSPMSCNVSLAESCPASLYYVPNTMKSLEEMASLFHVNANGVKKTIDGFLIRINCSCPADHNEFTSLMDYTVQPGDTWQTILTKFGSFVVEQPEKVLIPSRTIILGLFMWLF